MTGLGYPLRALWASYLRAGFGLGLMAWWLVMAQPGWFGSVLLGGLAAVFGVYGLRTALRQATRYGFDDHGVWSVGPISRAIKWDELANLKLSYYTTKRDGTSGWWQLDIKGRDSRMRLESTLDGFGALAERTVREARGRDVEMSPTTIDNVKQLGIDGGDGGT